MKRTSNLSDSWHPDLQTDLVELPYAQRAKHDDWVHYARVVGLTLLLSGSGFATVLLIRYVVLG